MRGGKDSGPGAEDGQSGSESCGSVAARFVVRMGHVFFEYQISYALCCMATLS